MLQKLKLWFESHKITAHAVSLGWLWLVGFYYSSQEARSWLDYEAHEVYIHFPKVLQGLIISVLVPMFIYWKTTKKVNL
jgi:hypothetical protein